MTARGGIVWLASFPKSGNTWFRIFLANLAAGENGPTDINDLDERGGIASSRHEFEAATLLDSGLLSNDDIETLRPRVYERSLAQTEDQRWIKVHDGYTLTPAGEPMFGLAGTRAVYPVRDPRDVAVSLAHHQNYGIDQAIAQMNDSKGTLSRSRRGLATQLTQKLLGWSGHVASWLDQRDIPVHPVRYEDLQFDPQRHFAAALAFAEREATPEQIDRAIHHAQFSEVQRQEGEKGFGERNPAAKSFFRAGRVGNWREVLNTEQVAGIEAAHGPMMRRLGYTLTGEEC